MKKIKSSLLGRAPKLLSSAIKLGQLKDIDRVVENLSELKGMPQKLGQMISMDFSEYIPPELRDKFSKLQSQSQEIEAQQILDIIQKELGAIKFNQIVKFNSIPLGAGSIGQVHSAFIGSQKIVFKVRYPEIEKTIKTDLSLMLPIAKTYEMFRPKSKDFTILMNEAKLMLIQEMDYQAEAQHLIFFKDALKDDHRFYIPTVLSELSNSRMICMEHVEGINLKNFIEEEYNTAFKTQIASNLLDLFIKEFFVLGTVQTDPNFANYLIKENNQIALLDFGATKKFSQEFRSLYFELLQSAYDKNSHDIIFYGSKLGLVDRKDNEEAIELFVSFMIDVMSFFRKENNPMDFSNEEITNRLLETGWKLWKKQKISSPNSNLVFLHRKLGGLFSLLKESKVKMDLYDKWIDIEKLNK